MVSHICLLVELGPICNSMAASLCSKSCEDHSLLKSYNVWSTDKQLQVWALKKKIRPDLLDTLAAMHVTCSIFLMHCFGFSESCNDLSFKESTFLKQNSLTLQKKSLICS